jgi:hypothetical protein
MLLGRSWRGPKQDVAARSVAGLAGEFFRDFVWALALAGQGRYDRRRGRGWWLRFGMGQPLSPATTVASGLFAAAFFAVGGGPVVLCGMPATPVASVALAGGAAVSCLGVSWQEPAFTALEQAPPAAKVPVAGGVGQDGRLTRGWCERRLNLAHGRACSREVRRRGGDTSRRPFAALASEPIAGDRATRSGQRTRSHLQRPRSGWSGGRTEPKPRSTDRGVGQLALRERVSARPLLTWEGEWPPVRSQTPQ